MVAYFRPNYPVTSPTTPFDHLETTINDNQFNTIGYFNIPHCYDSLSTHLDSNDNFTNTSNCPYINSLYNFTDYMNGCQINDITNSRGRILDLVNTNNVLANLIKIQKSDTALVPIDIYHPPIELLFYTHTRKKLDNTSDHANDQCYDFRRANCFQGYQLFQAQNWSTLYFQNDVNNAVEILYNSIYDIFNRSIPLKSINHD